MPQYSMAPGQMRGNGRLVCGGDKQPAAILEQSISETSSRPQLLGGSDNEEAAEALLPPTSMPETFSVQSGGFHSDASPLLAQSPTSPPRSTELAVTQSLASSRGSDENMEMISTV